MSALPPGAGDGHGGRVIGDMSPMTRGDSLHLQHVNSGAKRAGDSFQQYLDTDSALAQVLFRRSGEKISFSSKVFCNCMP